MQIYPVDAVKKNNGDSLYNLCVCVICWGCICNVILVSIIVILVNAIEKDEVYGSSSN